MRIFVGCFAFLNISAILWYQILTERSVEINILVFWCAVALLCAFSAPTGGNK